MLLRLVEQKRLNSKSTYPYVLLRVDKADMAGTVEAMKEYLRSCCGVKKVLLAYIIRKMVIVKMYYNYLQ